ncbi:condensation domain-containing protein [Lachnospiraceae bacterium ZAX-1]
MIISGKEYYVNNNVKNKGVNYMHISMTRFHEEMLELYKEVLERKDISFEDNFFQCGGDSVKAISLMEKINEKYNSKISLTDVLQFITGLELNVYDMATKLYEQIHNESVGDKELPLWKVNDVPSKIPLSFVQEGMWIEEIMNGTSQEESTQRYNVVGSSRIIVDNFDLDSFNQSLRVLIQETVALRISFVVEDFTPHITINDIDVSKFEVKIEDFTDKEMDEAIYLMEEPEKKYRYEFNKYPLFHFRLGRDKHGDIVFVIAIHHLIADAFSVLQLLLQRVEELYFGETGKSVITNKSEIDYIHYILWQRSSYDKAFFDSDFEYWKEKLKGTIPSLSLSRKESVDWQTCNSCSLIIDIEETIPRKLKELCSQEKATTYSGFVAVMYVFLYYMFDEVDLAIGGTNGGRTHEEFQSIIGNFASIQLLRTKIDPEKSFRDLMKRTKETVNGSYLHSSLPCGMMMREIGLAQNYFYLPYRIILNYVDAEIKSRKLFDRMIFSTNALVDFGLSILQPNGMFEMSFLYKDNLFSHQEVEGFAADMVKIISEIVDTPDKPIKDYEIMKL